MSSLQGVGVWGVKNRHLKCKNCGLKVVQRNNLTGLCAKCRLSRGERVPLRCNLCGKIFQRLDSLNCHIAKAHDSLLGRINGFDVGKVDVIKEGDVV